MTAPLLEARDVTRTFPGVRALDGVRFELRRGEVHALVGENGAGKSTLMHILGGVYGPDAGQVLLDGQPVRLASPYHAGRHGISVVFQELSLVPNLTVAENIFANRQPVRRLNLVDRRRLYADATALLALFGADIAPDALVKRLSVAEQQVVEIVKAISQQPRVLILDEPTSCLTSVETELLFRNIRRLKAEGMAFIYISHHLPEIFAIADRVTILRDGRWVDTCPVAGVSEADLVRKMVGRELSDVYGRPAGAPGEEYLQVAGAGRGGAFHDVSFSLRRGEILGLAGLIGSGRTELARALFGAEPLEHGTVLLNGKPLRVRCPADAIAAGIAYLTEDRKEQGLYLRMALRENCIAPSLRAFAGPLGFLSAGRVTAFAEECRDRFRIVTPSIHQQVRNLSGGNQQKVLLSMWMGIRPQVLIVDEPTRGVDVGARSDIYALLRQLAASGVGILMISSDLPEILGMSDRILVMRDGRCAAEMPAAGATEEKVIACMTGVAK